MKKLLILAATLIALSGGAIAQTLSLAVREVVPTFHNMVSIPDLSAARERRANMQKKDERSDVTPDAHDSRALGMVFEIFALLADPPVVEYDVKPDPNCLDIYDSPRIMFRDGWAELSWPTRNPEEIEGVVAEWDRALLGFKRSAILIDPGILDQDLH